MQVQTTNQELHGPAPSALRAGASPDTEPFRRSPATQGQSVARQSGFLAINAAVVKPELRWLDVVLHFPHADEVLSTIEGQFSYWKALSRAAEQLISDYQNFEFKTVDIADNIATLHNLINSTVNQYGLRIQLTANNTWVWTRPFPGSAYAYFVDMSWIPALRERDARLCDLLCAALSLAWRSSGVQDFYNSSDYAADLIQSNLQMPDEYDEATLAEYQNALRYRERVVKPELKYFVEQGKRYSVKTLRRALRDHNWKSGMMWRKLQVLIRKALRVAELQSDVQKFSNDVDHTSGYAENKLYPEQNFAFVWDDEACVLNQYRIEMYQTDWENMEQLPLCASGPVQTPLHKQPWLMNNDMAVFEDFFYWAVNLLNPYYKRRSDKRRTTIVDLLYPKPKHKKLLDLL